MNQKATYEELVKEISDLKRRNEVLEETNSFWKLLTNMLPQPVSYVDKDHTIRFANASYEKLFNADLSSMIGKHPKEFLGEEAFQRIHKRHEAALSGQEQEYESSFFLPNGEPYHFQAHYLPHIVKGNVEGFLAVVQDLTKLKETEKDLQESLLRQNEAIKAGKVGLWDWDLKTNRAHYSAEWKSQIGYEEHEITADIEEWRSRVHPDDLEPTRKKVKQSIARRQEHKAEFRFRHKDGSYRWILSQASILRDESGNPVRMMGSHIDITERKRAEEELAQVFSMSLDMICIADINTSTFVKVNPAFLEELGFSEAELLERSFLDFIHPDDIDSTRSVIENKLRMGTKVINFENRYRCKDGSYRWLSWVSHPDPERGLTYAVARDTTAHKEAAHKLRESEKRFRRLAENSPAVVYQFKMDEKGEFTFPYVSEALNKTIGVSPKVAMKDASRLLEMIHPDDREKFYLGVMKSAEGLGPYHDICRYLKDGEVKWIEALSVPESMPDGSILWDGFFLDVTLRKEAEAALKASEEKFSKAFQNAPLLMSITSLEEGRYLEVNDAFLQVTGYTREEVVGKTSTELGVIAVEARNQLPALLGPEKHLRDYEIEVTCKDGSKRVCLYSGELIEYVGKTRLLSIALDITERLRHQQEREKLQEQLLQAQKLEAIGTLSGGIAHDFNNILGIILGNTELAMDEVPEWSPARNNLEEVRKACQRAKDVIQQILNFSRKSRSETKPLNITPIIKETIKLLRASIPTSIEIRLNVPADVRTIRGDPTQIHQVLLNLCTNAAHAMENGGILDIELADRVLNDREASQYADVGPGRYVKLTVNDTGQGMPPDLVDRIFDPYFTTKAAGKGTGMGLAVVHGIVKRHGGAISVKSTPGVGTAFEILFPVADEEVAAKKPQMRESLPYGHERILFVDDEAEQVRLNEQRLDHLGYQVETRTDPVEALELFRSQPDRFDLVITDTTMPHMTGDRLAQEMMKIRPDIPILLCTGYSNRIDKDKAKEMGISGFAMKPLDMGQLARTVRGFLDRQEKEG